MNPPAGLISHVESLGQPELLAHWSRLEIESRKCLERELLGISPAEVDRLRQLIAAPPPLAKGPIEPVPQVVRGEHPDRDREAMDIGRELLSRGKVAAFVVAGGQGTRLGHRGPKGTFPATPILAKPLFRVFAEKIRARGKKAGAPIPWYVMTSPENHAETLFTFEQARWFGLARDDVRFFQQGTLPAMDGAGRLLLADHGSLFRSPDGHGGSLKALQDSGSLEDMERRGVEEVFYFQIDNPLVDVCDPLFLGYHRMRGSDFSSKAVPKRDPFEKVGVLVRQGGSDTVIEYSDLPESLREVREPDGKLRFRAGNVAIHVLRRAFVADVNRGGFRLPFHLAKKDIPCIAGDGSTAITKGIKFETFVFDALPLAQRTLVMEVRREDEFSPIKNKAGEDSPETSMRDQSALFARWLEEVGIQVGRGPDGRPVGKIEISPLFAEDAEDLAGRKAEIRMSGSDLLLDGE